MPPPPPSKATGSVGASGVQSDPSARALAAAPQSAIQRQFDQLYRATPLPMALVRSLGSSGPTPPPVVAPSPLKPLAFSPLDAMHSADRKSTRLNSSH